MHLKSCTFPHKILKIKKIAILKVKFNEIIGQIERTSIIIGLVTLNFIAESINPTVKCFKIQGLHPNKGLQNMQDLAKIFENLTIEEFKPIF